MLSWRPCRDAHLEILLFHLLWAIIVTIFARWAGSEGEKDRQARLDRAAVQKTGLTPAEPDLTFESVQEVFETTPAPPES